MSQGGVILLTVAGMGGVTTINGDSGSATPAAGVITISGGSTGLTTSASSSTVTFGGTLGVANGGTGATTLTGVLTGNGTSPFTASTITQYDVLVGGASNSISSVGPGSSGQILQSKGAAANPAYSTATYPATAGTSGTILTSNGTNIINTTATYPATTTLNQILYSSAANTIVGLATATNGVLITDGTTGIPSISSTLPTAVQGNITSVGTITSGTWNGTTIAVAHGGTGQTTLTNHGVLVGAATSAITQLAAGSAGQVLQSGGASADPAYSTATYPATASGTGTILRADGTNWSATTATYPNTTGANTMLISTSANVVTTATFIVGSTWTPALAFGGSSSGITYTTQTGEYTQIGNLVFFKLNILLSSKGAQTGNATITGFPVTAGGAVSISDVAISANTVSVTFSGQLFMTINITTTNATLFQNNNGTVSNITNTAFGNTSEVIATGFYFTS